MSAILSIPEVAGLSTAAPTIRIPPELNVPFTGRIRRIVDSAPFRRLARIDQLGLVSLVYPGATHRRFEHSLGVYRMALLFLRQLALDPRFAATVGRRDAERFIAAALLHDVGHWPFCHPIEDLRLDGVPSHERFVERHLADGEIAGLLHADWGLEPDDVSSLLGRPGEDAPSRLLASMLSGPIDIDKLDYLQRDSLHAGVPYGRHFDEGRLISSLCLDERGDGLALTSKGKTAAELMVFARYVMFSEVYWHHGVRAATAMFQRAFFELLDRVDLDDLFLLDDGGMVAALRHAAKGSAAGGLLAGLFDDRRSLYKRVAEFSSFEDREVYEAVARRPYPDLVACARELAGAFGSRSGLAVAPHEILVDAPPVEKEVEFRIDVYFPSRKRYRSLEEVSPVVRALAREQFDDHVKRVRIYAHPRVAGRLRELDALPEIILEAARHAAGTAEANRESAGLRERAGERRRHR